MIFNKYKRQLQKFCLPPIEKNLKWDFSRFSVYEVIW